MLTVFSGPIAESIDILEEGLFDHYIVVATY